MKGKNGIVGIVFARQENLKLQLLQRLVNSLHICNYISFQTLILVLHTQLPHNLYIIVLGYQSLVFVYADFNIIQFLIDFLSLLWIIPKGRLTHLIFQFSNFFFFVSYIQSLFHLCQSPLESHNFRLQILQHLHSHPN